MTDKKASKPNKTNDESSSPYVPMFDVFRSELDEHHDRRECVMKGSKDITALSKKIIFSLQRARSIGKPISDKRILSEVETHRNKISETFTAISMDLTGLNAYRYQRNISGGIQEFMEAILFQHYLETQSLMAFEQAAANIPAGVMLTLEDYLLGVFDMTGEVMKIAITSMATTGKVPGRESSTVLEDMQRMRTQLELMDVSGSYGLSRDWEGKLKVARQSVEKVEASVYSMMVRGSERPKGWRPDADVGGGGFGGGGGSEEIEGY